MMRGGVAFVLRYKNQCVYFNWFYGTGTPEITHFKDVNYDLLNRSILNSIYFSF